MRSLISIVARNMKVIYRSKMSSLLVFLVPILIVFLVGTAFSSNSLSNIQIGVYSSNYSELTESIILSLNDNQFSAQKMGDEESCINAVMNGNVHVCVIFPPDLSIKGNKDSVVIHADNSRMNLAYLLINQINSKISSRGSEIGIAMADDLLNVLNQVKDSLPSQKSGLNSVSSNIDDINAKVESISVNSVNESISKLDEVLASLDAIETEDDLSSLKSEINSVKESLISLNSNLESNTEDISEKASSGKTDLDLVSVKVDNLIKELSLINVDNAESIVMPIKTEVSAVSKDSSNWKHLFPTLTALILLLSGIVLSSSIVLTERRARAKFRNFLTPTSDLSFIFGAYITCFIILTIQLIILFVGTFYLTKLSIFEALGPVALVLFLAASVFMFLGMLIGYLFKSDETTILASISIASLLIFFSNAIIPTESIRGFLRYFAIYNPLYITDSLLKKIILFGEPLNSLYSQLILLGGMLFGLIILTLIARKMTKRLA